ncbi:hypothetical protein [Cellulosilyticum sp. I15G10I2]|uniref:hypothetical protein n=1 Tax=Cellulosilyticum sp. I15G10I2 TaxID=1892843 RepID=UPI00085C117E|nr:hypothetical protein [Cellulosilyticum sp. I15G10I2]
MEYLERISELEQENKKLRMQLQRCKSLLETIKGKPNCKNFYNCDLVDCDFDGSFDTTLDDL